MWLTGKILILGVLIMTMASPSFAFEHEHSPVKFLEYTPDIIENNKQQEKPFYLLFSAQWCVWCKVFAKKTLTEKKVYAYLNENFVNIFIDADIHTATYQKFKATGWPYTVFLNPDGSIHYQYAGTVYPDDFFEVLQEVRQNIEEGKEIPGHESDAYEYIPPTQLEKDRLRSFGELFRQLVLENFDSREAGVGKGEKAIFPQTFLYLLKASKKEDKAEAVLSIKTTLEKAIEHIYDPIEGGFFRYAEKRDWQIPHYEKMADLNAGIVLLLYKIAEETNSPELQKTADQTLKYLTTTLFDPRVGSFLSFQEADEHYYFLNANRRKNVQRPVVIQKIFTDRLALTLNYLIDTLAYTDQNSLEEKIKQSLNFLATMILDQDRIYHYYFLPQQKWDGQSSLPNYAYLGYLFQKAALHFNNDRYQEAASKILKLAKEKFYDREQKIFADGLTNSWSDIEYHMEMNGFLAQSMMQNAKRPNEKITNTLSGPITYFSAMDEIFEDQAFDTREWQFLERYVPYLNAVDMAFKR